MLSLHSKSSSFYAYINDKFKQYLSRLNFYLMKILYFESMKYLLMNNIGRITYEERTPTDKSLLSSDSVHKVGPSEV